MKGANVAVLNASVLRYRLKCRVHWATRPRPDCQALVCTSATTGLVFFSRRPSSLYNRKPENSAVQERSRNSMKILRAGPWKQETSSGVCQAEYVGR